MPKYRPFEYVDESNNDHRLRRRPDERRWLKLAASNMNSSIPNGMASFVALANGEFDAVISAVTITDERKEIS
jgi:hypothetical protein